MSKPASIEASAAKAAFGQLGKRAKAAPLEVTRHGRTEFVIVSPDFYARARQQQTLPEGALERLEAEFEALVSAMQSPQAGAAYDQLEALAPEALGAATHAARLQLGLADMPAAAAAKTRAGHKKPRLAGRR